MDEKITRKELEEIGFPLSEIHKYIGSNWPIKGQRLGEYEIVNICRSVESEIELNEDEINSRKQRNKELKLLVRKFRTLFPKCLKEAGLLRGRRR